MTCEYLVNGNWISEEDFKQVLNNGFLDNLIVNNIIDLKGFPLDETKIKSVEKTKTIVENKSIDAKILSKILIKEVTSRQGYPLNMKAALELNAEETDFKIPLWASPYASKFESLLTSMVSNRIVKQKFPGHSYVLGSEEGFRIKLKEGADAAKELKKSGIIFTDNFNPELGLQPMRPDPVTGKMLPAQIMIPFKFRDEDGNILDIKQFLIMGEDKVARIDFDKMPQKVLSLFGFRIPTQEQNSMAAVEIVGFLPESQGDLLLAPRDFTKQMGSDFDVDKLYTYMYNTYYKDGKLHTDFLSSKKKINEKLKEAETKLNALYSDLELSKEDIKFIKEFTKDREEFINEHKELLKGEANNIKLSEFIISLRRNKQKAYDIKDAIKYEIDKIADDISVLKRSFTAANQNKILDIHQRVMLSNNKTVIKSIISLDSFGEFEGLAAEIDSIRSTKLEESRIKQGLGPTTLTMLSDIYQRTQYLNAAAGKNGVGTLSLDSTFNASAQGKDLIVVNIPSELLGKGILSLEYIKANNSPVETFGDIVSKGDLSNKFTLASQKLIEDNGGKITDDIKDKLKLKSFVIRCLQSSAVDAQKAKILDKINFNDETADAVRALTLLGFEEEDVVGLLTQDIIWDYVDLISDARSSIREFTPDVEDVVKNKLKTKYDPEGRLETLTDAEDDKLTKLANKSGKELIDNLKTQQISETVSSDSNLLQYFILLKFQNLTEIGKDIKKLQSAINTESKGVPKSIIEANTKLDQVNNIGNSNIFNAEKLLGEYKKTPTGSILTNPTTINGFASFYGTKTANQVFNKYFPYKTEGFKTIVKEIAYYSYGEEAISSAKQTELTKDIFQNIRSFLYATRDTGLFTDTALEERSRLFIDVKNKNKSLATILDECKKQSWFAKNGFLNKLDTKLNSNGDISRINFEAAAGENFDERNIYLGFVSLLSTNYPIGNFNGIAYTSRTLAQDLVMAAFLEGGNQGAKQYLKYVPSSYLKTINFGDYLHSVDFDFINTFGGAATEDGSFDPTRPSKYARQYFQNNPSSVKKITLENIEGSPKKIPEIMELNSKEMRKNFIEVIVNGETVTVQRQFLSLFDNSLPGKYAMFEYDFGSGKYKRIPVLAGEYGFQQYDLNAKFAKSAVLKNAYNKNNTTEQLSSKFIPPNPNAKGPIKNNLKETEQEVRTDLRGPEKINDLLNKLETSPLVSSYNKELLIMLRQLPDVDKVNLVFSDTLDSVGLYNISTNTITLNLEKMKEKKFTANQKASTILHELVHAYSSDLIKKYQKNALATLTEEQIKIIKKLESLQEDYIDKLIKDKDLQGLLAFNKRYWEYKIAGYKRDLADGKYTKESVADAIAYAESRIKKGPKGIDSSASEFPENIDSEELSKYYGAIKLEEFVTMALTDEGFQKLLNESTTKEPLPFWQNLVDLLIELIEAGLGFKINKDSILPSAIEESLNLLKTNINGPPKVDLPKPSSVTPNPTNGITEGIDYVFKQNPALASIGTPLQYSEYLNSIFPNSKVKHIVFHGTAAPNILESLTPQNERIYFSDLTTASRYANWDQFNREQYEPGAATKLQTIAAIVNLENPVVLNGVSYTETETKKEGDGIIGTNIIDPLGGVEDQILVRSAEQAHVLGSPKDIEGFKEFIAKPIIKTSAEKTEDKLNLEIKNINKKYEIFPEVFTNEGQSVAIDRMTDFLKGDKKEFLLKGRGGTGKTTIVKKVIAESGIPLDQIIGATVADEARGILAANLPAGTSTATIASLLGLVADYRPKGHKDAGTIFFRARNEKEDRDFNALGKSDPIESAKLLIIDEASMISDEIYKMILSKKSNSAKVIFMGDNAQLPPIEDEGESKDSPVFNLTKNSAQFAELTERMRQGEESPILPITDVFANNIENIQKGEPSVSNPLKNRVSNFDEDTNQGVLFLNNKEKLVDQFVKDFRQNDDLKNAIIITGRNATGDAINTDIRKKLFNTTEPFVEGDVVRVNSPHVVDRKVVLGNGFKGKVVNVTSLGVHPKLGLPLYELKLSYESFDPVTGDTVTMFKHVTTISPKDKSKLRPMLNKLATEAKSNKIPWRTFYDMKELVVDLGYNYAITAHKVQGSTYKNVYVIEDDIMSFPGGALQQNRMMYTAVSRPTTKLVIYSNKNSISKISTKSFNINEIPLEVREAMQDPDKVRYMDDEEAYRKEMGYDELIDPRLLNPDEVEKFLLLCKK